MNPKCVTLLLALLTAVAGPVAADALARPGQGPGAEQREERGPERRLERMAVVLDLSAGQKAEAEALLKANRDRLKSLHEQLRQGRDAVRQAALEVPFDEAKVRALASDQAKLQVELMVARARLQNQLQVLLTPEQQAKAAALKPQRGEGRGHHGGGF